MRPTSFRCHVIAACVLSLATFSNAEAQLRRLGLQTARERARAASPALLVAQHAVAVARGHERQSGAIANPAFSYNREQARSGGQIALQDIAVMEQLIEIGGQRSARRAAARSRRQAAEQRARAVALDVDLEAARAFVAAWGADRRSTIAFQTAQHFARATKAMNQRLAEGDISGYAARRVRLENARYAALAAATELERESARFRLSELLRMPADSIAELEMPQVGTLSLDSLSASAAARSAELQAYDLEARAAAADAAATRRARMPAPALSAGYKRESTTDDVRLNGFVAGIGFSLPLWDRRAGAIEAASAEVRRLAAERFGAERRFALQLQTTRRAVQRLDLQIDLLRGQLGEEAAAAVRAAEAAYAEGEISLAEWLDAVRAYQEAEMNYTSVLTESLLQRAQLERLLGTTILR